MENNNYFDRFKKISKSDWVIIGFMTALLILALYMCIAFSVKMAQGLTLFGDSNAYTNTVETSGPTGADISVLILYWVLTVLLGALDVYFVFFRKIENKKVSRKEIVDGRTVIMKEEEDHAEK